MAERRQQAQPVIIERRRETFLILRVTPEQRQKLAAVASLNSMDTSAFVRQAIDEAVLDCTDAAIFGA